MRAIDSARFIEQLLSRAAYTEKGFGMEHSNEQGRKY